MRSNSFTALDRKERRTIYRITTEKVIPSSTVNRREYHTVHRRQLLFTVLRLFSRNEYVSFFFISCPEAITDGKGGALI